MVHSVSALPSKQPKFVAASATAGAAVADAAASQARVATGGIFFFVYADQLIAEWFQVSSYSALTCILY